MVEWFFLTYAMGAVFVAGQVCEYATLVSEHVSLSSRLLRLGLLPHDRLPRPARDRWPHRLPARASAASSPSRTSGTRRRRPRSSCRTTGTSSTSSGSASSSSSTSSNRKRNRTVHGHQQAARASGAISSRWAAPSACDRRPPARRPPRAPAAPTRCSRHSATAETSASASQALVDEGEKLFPANCATCHGLDAAGHRPAAPRSSASARPPSTSRSAPVACRWQITGPQAEEKPVQFTDEQIAGSRGLRRSRSAPARRSPPSSTSPARATSPTVPSSSASTAPCATTSPAPVAP